MASLIFCMQVETKGLKFDAGKFSQCKTVLLSVHKVISEILIIEITVVTSLTRIRAAINSSLGIHFFLRGVMYAFEATNLKL